MDLELLINPPESDKDLFDTCHPPSMAQQLDHSQASKRSGLRSSVSVPHTSRHFQPSSPNEIPPTPDKSQASSPSPVRATNRGHNRHSQHQCLHRRQRASFTAPSHSLRRTRHASRTNLRSETELEIGNTRIPLLPVMRSPLPPGLSILSQRSTTSNTSLRNASDFNRLSPATPPHPIFPSPANKRSSANAPVSKGVDRHGRPILYQDGRMVCNNFNDLGCSLSSCRLMQVCSFCGGAHARSTCPHNPT
ncbi:hypothetical protein NQZ68_028529 [Dissostichus eleginoides]|nr:hypothetical protein NQZ68_028529 [Dissostichus eleginoides]